MTFWVGVSVGALFAACTAVVVVMSIRAPRLPDEPVPYWPAHPVPYSEEDVLWLGSIGVGGGEQ